MDTYTSICSNVLFPLHESIKRHHSVGLRRDLELSQWWDRERLDRTQAQRLRTFLADVATNVPFYRQLFSKHRFVPDDLGSVDELQAIPLLTKQSIRSNQQDMKSATAKHLAKFNTGGSSGEPLVFFMGRDRVSHDVAAKWRATRWWGVDIGDPEVVLWGSPIELRTQDRLKAVRDRIFRSHLLPAFEMSDSQMDRHLDEIARIRPRMLFGYASALALLASHAERCDRPMDGLGIRVAFTTGESLYPEQRAIIERVFGTKVANGYGARDAGFIAHECEQGSLHVSHEHIVVEILDGNGMPVVPGDMGEIVVTHTATGAFPFIRYRTGDMAAWSTEDCPCGRGLPVLREVYGRSTDFIRTKAGNTMHALALIYEVRDKPGVQAFKFLQHEDLSVELKIVGDAALTEGVEREIRDGLLARLGSGVELTIRRVSEIPAEPSGKYRYVVSHAEAGAQRRVER